MLGSRLNRSHESGIGNDKRKRCESRKKGSDGAREIIPLNAAPVRADGITSAGRRLHKRNPQRLPAL